MPQLQQVGPEEAEALYQCGVEILYRFKGWPTNSKCSKLSTILSSEKRSPMAFYATYEGPAWTGTGTPIYFVEVE